MIASNRTRRATLKARQLANRAAARIRRRGTGTLAAHAMAQGLSRRDATSVAGTLRKIAKNLGMIGAAGRAHAGRKMRVCYRFTRTQVAVIALNYKARKPAYRLVAAKLALAA
ncbi:hypothetical protein [Streptomyces microflavus]|uniref:hypothetical protein n=1 Tax=Streptomyces microflavus TaxID=1919 RepID=UPI002E30B66D|nr:hypothetical protein [Streptomyces microflavus]